MDYLVVGTVLLALVITGVCFLLSKCKSRKEQNFDAARIEVIPPSESVEVTRVVDEEQT
jgi:hypothetical protein